MSSINESSWRSHLFVLLVLSCGLSSLCFLALRGEGRRTLCQHCVSSCKAFLLNEDLGDSLDSVEALLKKHEDFEKSLSAQEEKITVRHLPGVHAVT